MFEKKLSVGFSFENLHFYFMGFRKYSELVTRFRQILISEDLHVISMKKTHK